MRRIRNFRVRPDQPGNFKLVFEPQTRNEKIYKINAGRGNQLVEIMIPQADP